MTKTELTSAIGTAMSIVISRVKLLLGISKIVDEIYATPFSDTHLTTNVFTKANTSFSYNIQGVKTGRNVVVSGSFRNTTGDAIADIDLANITNSEFNHFVFSPTKKIIAKNLTGQLVLMELSSNKINLQGIIPNTGLFYFEFTYQTAN